MKRYVLRYAGTPSRTDPATGQAGGHDACRLVQRAGGRVIDDAPDMLLVEGSPATCKALAELLPDWTVSLDVMTPVPSVPRPSVRSSRRN